MGTSKGYRQHSGGYYDDDVDTEEYTTRYRQKQVYDDRINGNEVGNEDKEDSDWSEDEQLGVVDDYSSYVEMPESNKKSKRKKKKKKKKDTEYDVNVNDLDSMPMNQSGDDDAIEVQIHSKENADYDQFYEQNETLRDEDLESDKED